MRENLSLCRTILSLPEIPPDVPSVLKEQANLELRLAKRQRIMWRVLLQKLPLRLQVACLPQGDLLSTLPSVALRCYAPGPQLLHRLVYRLYDMWPKNFPIECPVNITEVDREELAALMYYNQCREHFPGQCDPDGWVPEETSECDPHELGCGMGGVERGESGRPVSVAGWDVSFDVLVSNPRNHGIVAVVVRCLALSIFSFSPQAFILNERIIASR